MQRHLGGDGVFSLGLDPVRRGERIQGAGAIIAADLTDRRIVALTETAASLIGVTAEATLGRALCDVAPSLAAEVDALAGRDGPMHAPLDEPILGEGGAYDVVAHTLDHRLLLEFLPDPAPDGEGLKARLRFAARAVAAIRRSGDFGEALEIAADATRTLLGYDRVRICRFEPDGAGLVVAESLSDPGAERLKGARFGGEAFPPEARTLLTRAPFRAVGDASTAEATQLIIRDEAERPLDLALSLLRPPSATWAARLGDMGARAALTAGVLRDGGLWGAVVCHGDAPRWPRFEDWMLFRGLGAALMARHDSAARTEAARKMRQVRAAERLILGERTSMGNLRRSLSTLLPMVQETLNADGCALICGGGTVVSGRVPPPEIIAELSGWVETTAGEDCFHTTRLPAIWPVARDHVESACGVLAASAGTNRTGRIIWFRGHAGGAPRSPGEEGEQARSAPWADSDAAAAREILSDILDVIVDRARPLIAGAASTDEFDRAVEKAVAEAVRGLIGSAVHDLKGPLRAIEFALRMMRREDFAPDAVEDAYRIADIAGGRLAALTGGLLELSRLQDAPPRRQRLDMEAVLADARAGLEGEISRRGAAFDIDPPPVVYGDRDQMVRLFSLLFVNALAYRAGDRPPAVEVRGRHDAAGVVFTVADNGIGVAPEYAEAIFEPMRRLHSKDEIEGAGLGLAICRRIARNHGGSIRLTPREGPGACFTVSFPAEPAAAVAGE